MREKLGNEAVDSLIELLNQAQLEQKKDILEFVEEKFERRLSEEITGVRNYISEVEKRLLQKISAGDQSLFEKIVETKADLIKWMFIFWVGQVGVILGILFAFFRT